MNSTATLRALIAAKDVRDVDNNRPPPPAKSETPRNTIQGTPFDRHVCMYAHPTWKHQQYLIFQVSNERNPKRAKTNKMFMLMCY